MPYTITRSSLLLQRLEYADYRLNNILTSGNAGLVSIMQSAERVNGKRNR